MLDHHRNHRPVVADGQLELLHGADLANRPDSVKRESVHEWKLTDTNRVVGLAAIHEARRLLEEAALHEADSVSAR